MGGLLHLVQRGGDWAGPQPAQAPTRRTKCNSPPINGQCTNFVLFHVALWLPLESKRLKLDNDGVPGRYHINVYNMMHDRADKFGENNRSSVGLQQQRIYTNGTAARYNTGLSESPPARSYTNISRWVTRQLCIACHDASLTNSSIDFQHNRLSREVFYMTTITAYRWGIITGPPAFKRHNLVNIRFIYIKISGTIAERMLSLHIWR